MMISKLWMLLNIYHFISLDLKNNDIRVEEEYGVTKIFDKLKIKFSSIFNLKDHIILEITILTLSIHTMVSVANGY